MSAGLTPQLGGQGGLGQGDVTLRRPALRVLTLLARLERDEKHDEAAALAWLAKAGEARPEPAWTCGACHAAAPAFSVCCPACGAPGRLEWT